MNMAGRSLCSEIGARVVTENGSSLSELAAHSEGTSRLKQFLRAFKAGGVTQIASLCIIALQGKAKK